MLIIDPIIKKPNENIPSIEQATATSKYLRLRDDILPINAMMENIINIIEQLNNSYLEFFLLSSLSIISLYESINGVTSISLLIVLLFEIEISNSFIPKEIFFAKYLPFLFVIP